jgi:uridine kinase
MIGDVLIIKEHHTKVAKEIYQAIKDQVAPGRKICISVAGESGSGKSEMGNEIKNALIENGIKAEVLGQDSYFVYPPKTNHNMRQKNPDQVGLYEVKLDLLDANLFAFKNGAEQIYKPIVNYDEDRIMHELKDVKDVDVLVTEGTYTTSLEYVDIKVFINRTFHDTKADRAERGREKYDPFIEKILETEHEIISSHKSMANILIKPDFSGIDVVK